MALERRGGEGIVGEGIGLFHVSTWDRIGVERTGLERIGGDGRGLAYFMCSQWTELERRGLDWTGQDRSEMDGTGLFYVSTEDRNGKHGS